MASPRGRRRWHFLLGLRGASSRPATGSGGSTETSSSCRSGSGLPVLSVIGVNGIEGIGSVVGFEGIGSVVEFEGIGSVVGFKVIGGDRLRVGGRCCCSGSWKASSLRGIGILFRVIEDRQGVCSQSSQIGA
ncbi:hypothetical protein B0H66DRAFT_547246 [Apodospora peruviana]|uniref:Uncharacterized protein n=1 Tax=Apodospora peruviana TaxID=516989 RepID=A0AAE0IH69_9PEZI|nr:hypothetical protein B0H66DRAFT_547246 [Apodospora peruviana]